MMYFTWVYVEQYIGSETPVSEVFLHMVVLGNMLTV